MRVRSESKMTGFLLKRRNVDRHAQQGRMLMEDEGRDQDDTSISQGRLKTVCEPPEPGRGLEQILPHSP